MAGYSQTPLAKKLGIKPGARVALAQAPPEMRGLLEPLPADVRVADGLRAAGLDVIVLFPRSAADLERRFAAAARRLAPAGGLWIAWPKRASGVETDLGEDIVRRIGLEAGLVDNKVCAISEVWSGLRFVIRVADRGR